MTPTASRRLAFALWIATILLQAATLVLAILNRSVRDDWVLELVGFAMPLSYSTVGYLVASRRPANTVGWLFLLVGFNFSVSLAADTYMVYGLVVAPGTLPGIEIAALISANIGFVLAIMLIPLALLLFPNGSVPSTRWRPVAWAMVVFPLVAVVGLTIKPGPIGSEEATIPNPAGIEALAGAGEWLARIGAVGSVAVALLCVAGLIVRYRRSKDEGRRQIRWLAYVGAAAALQLALSFALDETVVSDALFVSFMATLGLGIPIACGIAILRHGLYDLDLVLKRTVVFGILAAFITLLYFVFAVGIPTLIFGTGGGVKNLVPFVATALLAIAFQPVRRAAQRFADRLVYGRRQSPYEVLAEFSDRMARASSPEDVLPAMAEIARTGVGATRAEVWLRVGRDLRRAAVAPAGDVGPRNMEVVGEELPHIEDVDVAAPVLDRGELVGAVAAAAPRNAPFSEGQERLIRDLAAHAALALRNVRLIEELRASRGRLVAAQDEERRKLERNIHDGAQQQLVALSVRLKLAETIARKKAPDVAEMLDGIRGETTQALENLRDLARGIYPPLLADKGLAAALESQARKVPFPVEVRPNGDARYAQEVEAAIYFCVLEALQNAAKYAGASRAVVRLESDNGDVVFEVVDDGRGFDPESTARGAGLQNMEDRLAALGGSLDVTSSPGEGTRVTGRVPAMRELGS